MHKIILASGSPRRSQLLESAEIPFDVMIAATDESYPNDLLPDEIAIHIAFTKALAVQNILKENEPNSEAHTIIAADTIVVLGNEIIGKPVNREDAIKTLLSLSGKAHKVITGVSILSAKEKIEFAEETQVEFHELSQKQIEFYVDKYKPYDKAGAYAIQEWIGIIGIKSIKGDFYNVMGLPVSRVVKELEKLEK
jgi:septum formation protein